MTSANSESRDADRGAGVVLLVGLMALCLVLGTAAWAVAQFSMDRSRAATAADLAALSGAEQIMSGDGCLTAERVAQANGAAVIACRVIDLDVVLEVSVESGPMVRRLAALAGKSAPHVRAKARAGERESGN